MAVRATGREPAPAHGHMADIVAPATQSSSIYAARPANEISVRLGEVQEWVAEWEQTRQGSLRVEYTRVGGRHIGSNFSAASATTRRSVRSSAATLAGPRSSASCTDRWAAAYTRSIRTMVIRSPSTSYSTR